MELVQFEIPGAGRRVGIREGELVRDLTARRGELRFVLDVFDAAFRSRQPLEVFLRSVMAGGGSGATLDWESLWRAAPGGSEPFLLVPVDHPDPHRVLVSGTGLTHTGSMLSSCAMRCTVRRPVANPRRLQTKQPSARGCDGFGADVRAGTRRRKAGRRQKCGEKRLPNGSSKGTAEFCVAIAVTRSDIPSFAPGPWRRGAGDRRLLRDRSGRPAAAPGVCPGERMVGPCHRKDQLPALGAVQTAHLCRRPDTQHTFGFSGDRAAACSVARTRTHDLRQRPEAAAAARAGCATLCETSKITISNIRSTFGRATSICISSARASSASARATGNSRRTTKSRSSCPAFRPL